MKLFLVIYMLLHSYILWLKDETANFLKSGNAFEYRLRRFPRIEIHHCSNQDVSHSYNLPPSLKNPHIFGEIWKPGYRLR